MIFVLTFQVGVSGLSLRAHAMNRSADQSAVDQGPLTILEVLTPHGSMRGGETFMITGDGFVSGETGVTIGGVPCLNPILKDYPVYATILTCTTGQSAVTGQVPIVVENGGRRVQLEQLYVYTEFVGGESPQIFLGPKRIVFWSPGSGFTLPSTRPIPVFQDSYAGSEAEAFRNALEDHQRSGSWLDEVSLLDRTWDIRSLIYQGADSDQAGYQIQDGVLIQRMRQALGVADSAANAGTHPTVAIGGESYSQSQILRAEEADPGIFNAIIQAQDEWLDSEWGDRKKKVIFHPSAFPGAAQEVFPLNLEVKTYLAFIRETLSGMLNFLNQSPTAKVLSLSNGSSRRYYHNQYYGSHAVLGVSGEVLYGGGIYIHNSTDVPSSFHGHLYFKVMDAIREDNEQDFLTHLVNLATAFDPSLIEARNGLLDTMTFLFVAKRFPTTVACHMHLHFTLRCGGIY